ncbi:hypothetical protein D3C77_302850 [compost metagenome]
MALTLAVAIIAHEGDHIISLLIYLGIFAVMLAIHGFHAFREPDETDRKTAVLDQFTHWIFGIQLLAAFPYAFAHHEIGRLRLLGCLDLEAVQQPVQGDIHVMLQFLIEALLICCLPLS